MRRQIPWGRSAAVIAALAIAFTLAGLVTGRGPSSGSGPDPRPARRVAAAPAMARLPAADLQRGISTLQDRLKARPKDAGGWAALGTAYVDQARVTADPGRYTQAQRAFARSLREQPDDNDAALAGQAALAAARHDFASALRLAEQALKVNPYGETALAVHIDALVELGRYREAYTAADRADAAHPGIPIFTRIAYVLELRGRTGRAREVLEQALESATAPGDTAYVATALGELARGQGQYSRASRHYATALRADPGYLAALTGRGRTRAARGDLAGAVADLEKVVRQQPLPAHLALLGELYEAQHKPKLAKQQYGVVDTWVALARANKVTTDLDTSLVAADHGSRAEALRAARAEWGRRHSVHTADALAWALHVNGKEEEALGAARQATGAGYRNALFLYHRGMIEKSLGKRADARRHLAAALHLDPGFSPAAAPRARAALAALEREGGAQ